MEMQRTRRVTVAVALALSIAAISEGIADDKAQGQDQSEISESALAFEKAYNAHEVDKLSEQFTSDAIVVDETGETVTGREEIGRSFRTLFETFPKAKMSISLDSIRLVAPGVAVEDGWTSVIYEPDTPAVISRYTVVHVKKDGHWQMASVRDFPANTELTPHQHLQTLEWMVGEWVDESQESMVETSCRWSKDGNFLLQDFTVRWNGISTIQGTQRIGWDPVRRQIRSWVFDSSGGFGESVWLPDGYGWAVKASGVTPDGQMASATRMLIRQGADSYLLRMTERFNGDERLPDVEVTVVRRPPNAVSANKAK